jgi:hypothetical protein
MDPQINQPNTPAVGTAPSQQTDEGRDPRWFWLTVAQYALIIAVTIIFVYVIANGVKDVGQLADMDTARGLITFVVTLGTVAIAMMLALTAVVTRDFDKRLTIGKEILTILVGVLGTIVGFYYGAATKKDAASSANPPAAQISIAPVRITPAEQVQSGAAVGINSKISGGTPPYRYSIRFTPESIPAIENQESLNGDINHEFKAAVLAGTDILFLIEGRDKNGVPFTYNKDGKQKVLVR